MARTVTLGKLRGLARLYADQRSGSSDSERFVPDAGSSTTAGLNDLVNLALAQLYDLLVEAKGADYYAASDTFQTVATQAEYDLPGDFYQAQGVLLKWSTTDHEPVAMLPHRVDKAGFADVTWSAWDTKAYRIEGNSLVLYPIPSAVVDVELLYTPVCPTLVSDADTFDGVDGWEKLVALKVAQELREIEQQGPGNLANLYAEELARIESLKTERDAQETVRVRQVFPEGRAGWPFTRGRF